MHEARRTSCVGGADSADWPIALVPPGQPCFALSPDGPYSNVPGVENELQPVLKALRAGGINIVAIHHHMSGENPRILFLHYWGRGKAGELATTVKKALDLTAWDKGAPAKA